jgi:hypothetical protein
MRIEIVKRADGAGVLRCTRDDGSVTWQKQKDGHARFFALHDLTHYAVETTLGLKRGFFGLLKEGWDIDDTQGKGPRGPLPRDAMEAERIVGLLDGERISGTIWTIEEFHEFAGDVTDIAHRLTPETIAAIKKRRSELFEQWAAVPAGESLKLML